MVARPAPPPDIRSLERDELRTIVTEMGQPAYRADQILQGLYSRFARGWDELTSLPKTLRMDLAQRFRFHVPEVAQVQGSKDTTRKILWKLSDGAYIESVLIPANPALFGEASDRRTLCISTQVGCAYGCRFCASGLDGWKRNLEPQEIVGQIVDLEREKETYGDEDTERLITNIVVMGMGEPMANYDNLLKALRILNASWGAEIGARRITISTSGLAPQIERLAQEPFQFRLAISLHGATNEARDQIMPVNRKYPLERLVAACERYQDAKGKMITFEYILIRGVNDGLEQTAPLAQMAKRLRAKINLIPYNRVDGLDWERPAQSVQEAFLDALRARGAQATLRREKGHDIDAACGQLRLKQTRADAAEAPPPQP